MTTLRKVHAPQAYDYQEMAHFSLHGILPDDHVLALNTRLGTLSSLVCRDGLPTMLEEQQFSTGEMAVLIPLLESYPYYCPYEAVCASFNTGHVTGAEVERSRKYLLDAQEAGVWDTEMRPIRSVISRVRLKIRLFGIDVSSILETGYLLRQLPKEGRSLMKVQ